MNELTINLSGFSIKDFYGENNNNLEIIISYFPQIKIIAKDYELKAIGNNNILLLFNNKINLLIKYLNKYGYLNKNNVEEIILSKNDFFLEKNPKSIIYSTIGNPIIPKTKNQLALVEAIKKNDLVFAIGPSGTGKTYISVALAVKALKNKNVERIILTRPAIEVGESLGFLPGDLKEKFNPYLQPIYQALNKMIKYEKLIEFFDKRIIEIAPLAFMRGRTLDNAFVILDEAQNTTNVQMKMFLTRMGKNAKFIINGDPGQIDLPNNNRSGLLEVMNILNNINGIKFIFFNENDILRHYLVNKIINAYLKLSR
ncbi:MAG: PhoH family protein [Candidatus Bostrichicola ureolyticus]|nr:MAG: PhoH family protein [Candidatus Bostrichicola ureolyticus]